VPDPRKGEALVLLTDNQDARLDDLPAAFKRQGITELSTPRRLIKLDKLPVLGTGKPDYARLLEIVAEQMKPD
jgi:acyl-[acyl-carrier-protein]-phospholipid O-acyltransferase/long-chain-fatty-acid--[acyl-carrier-protein] ligase